MPCLEFSGIGANDSAYSVHAHCAVVTQLLGQVRNGHTKTNNKKREVKIRSIFGQKQRNYVIRHMRMSYTSVPESSVLDPYALYVLRIRIQLRLDPDQGGWGGGGNKQEHCS